MPKLQISIPNVGDITHELSADEITIGRSSDNKIQIKDDSVSSSHARLIKADGAYHLEDLGSTNGTFFNGTQVKRQALDSSAALRFGNIAAFFHQEPTPGADELLKVEVRKLQSQLAAVREARDLVHNRNQELLRERDDATQVADIAAAELAEFKLKSGAAPAEPPRRDQESEARIEEQRTQVLSLLEERNNLEKRLQEKTAAEQQRSEKIQQLERQLEELNQSRSALEQKANESAGAAEEANRLRAELEEVRSEARQGAESQAEIRARLEQERDAAAKELQARLEELEAQKAAAESDRQNAIEKAESELAGVREEIAALSGRLEAAESNRHTEGEKSAQEKQGLADELEALQKRNAELVGERDQARSVAAGEGESMQATLNELRAEVAAARNTQEKSESARSQTETELKASQTALEMAQGELQTHHDSRKGDLEERGRKISALEAEKHLLEQNLAHEHESVSSARNESEKASAELQRLRHELDEVRQHNEMISKECEALRRRQQAMVGRLDEQQALEQARAELATLRQEKERADRLAGEIETFRTEASARAGDKSEMSTLRESLAAVEKERDEEARRSDQMEQKIRESERSLAGELAGLREAQAAAEARLAEKDARLESQQVQVENLRRQLESLTQKSMAAAPATPPPLAEAPANGHPAKAEEPTDDGGRAMRPRRAAVKVEQRLRGRSGGDSQRSSEAGVAVATVTAPRWSPPRQRAGAPPTNESGRPVFPEEVVAQDTIIIGKFPDLIAQTRGDLQYLIRHPNDRKALETLIGRSKEMSELARTTVFEAVYQMASALDSLLADLHATPERINQATLRTVTQSIDFMHALVEPERIQQTLSLPRPHVLVIDDEPDIIEAIVGSMELVGLHASGSSGAQSAIEELGRAKFDLVFLDVGLPDLSGWDLCQRIRGIPEHRRTPIVFVTGASSIENKVKSTLQGGNDFVGKPFNVREIGIKALSWVYRGQLGMI